jgi:hypothetical protein
LPHRAPLRAEPPGAGEARKEARRRSGRNRGEIAIFFYLYVFVFIVFNILSTIL